MRWPWQQAPPAQSVTEQLIRTLERRIEILERAEKQLQAEADEWIVKYRTLYARTCKAAERIERQAPQDAPGSTIGIQSGGNPPPPPDRWVGLARDRATRRGA
jgi:hypothetical protein